MYTLGTSRACKLLFSHALQYTIHKVPATVTGLPADERFVTIEERPDGIMENHWLWTSEREMLDVKSAE